MTPLSLHGDADAKRIAELNDAFRTTGKGGQIVVTGGVLCLPDVQFREIMDRVHRFDSFTPDNDPHGEHDFGSVAYDGIEVFWKIDYYNPALEAGSDDPADVAKTVRVMTIMLAEEY